MAFFSSCLAKIIKIIKFRFYFGICLRLISQQPANKVQRSFENRFPPNIPRWQHRDYEWAIHQSPRTSGATEAPLPVPVSSATQLCARLQYYALRAQSSLFFSRPNTYTIDGLIGQTCFSGHTSRRKICLRCENVSRSLHLCTFICARPEGIHTR